MYVIVVVPAVNPVTIPEPETEATAVLELVQGVVASGVPDPVRVTDEPSHTVNNPVTVGFAFTVTVAVSEQPLLSK